MAAGRQDVLVIYGGRSAEHEISCRSAAFILRNLDPEKYDVHAIAIDKDGTWLPQNTKHLLANLKGPVPIERSVAAQTALPAGRDPAGNLLALLPGGSAPDRKKLVVFPILHGTFGEDGTMQGLLELAEVAFVGPDTMGSAIGMDKVVSKKLVQAAGVPVVPWLETRQQYWAKHKDEIANEAVKALGFPMFVKPVRLGSSVGITKVQDLAALKKACDNALSYDDKIMIEKGLAVREIECAVLGDYDPEVSVPGEVIPHAEFYTYEAKYLDEGGASMAIPANLDAEQTKMARDLSRRVFMALDLYGMARVDLFLEKGTNKFYFNEVNTIPGFTEISQFPLLWKESGVDARQLLDRLVGLAVKRQETKRALKRNRV